MREGGPGFCVYEHHGRGKIIEAFHNVPFKSGELLASTCELETSSRDKTMVYPGDGSAKWVADVLTGRNSVKSLCYTFNAW